MKQKFFSIGKAARMMNVTVKALRFYDQIGLLKPEYVDPETQYRYYGANQLAYINLIKAARSLSISPDALVPHFKNKDSGALIKLIQQHKEALSQKITELQKTIIGVDAVAETLDMAARIDKSGSLYTRAIPDRFAVTKPLDISRLPDDLDMEVYLLNAMVSSRGLTHTHESGVLYTLRGDALRPECIFACVLADEALGEYRLFPGGDYICTVMTGENAQTQYEKLMAYASDHQLRPQFVVQAELLTDLFTDAPEYYEIQMKAEP